MTSSRAIVTGVQATDYPSSLIVKQAVQQYNTQNTWLLSQISPLINLLQFPLLSYNLICRNPLPLPFHIQILSQLKDLSMRYFIDHAHLGASSRLHCAISGWFTWRFLSWWRRRRWETDQFGCEIWPWYWYFGMDFYVIRWPGAWVIQGGSQRRRELGLKRSQKVWLHLCLFYHQNLSLSQLLYANFLEFQLALISISTTPYLSMHADPLYHQHHHLP
jgi:hypothetical protein